MYKLNFIEKVEKEMEILLSRKDKYLDIKSKADELKKEIEDIASKAEKIEDENSKEYNELFEKGKNAQVRLNNLNKLLKEEESKFESVKQYLLKNLKINKAIIEKYKDLDDDKDIKDFKKGLQEYSIKEELLDQKLVELSEKLKFNDLSADEIKAMAPEKRKKVNEAREQYLNNKKQFEKYQKIKYASLVRNETPKNRIFQYESAIADIEKNFSIENIEDVMTRLEETLKIEKQRPQFIFDEKTHLYTYIDERGKAHEYDYFEKGENGEYKSTLTDTFVKTAIESLKARGLSRKQIKTVDMFLLKTLIDTGRDDLYENYLQSIKDGKKTKFDLKYLFTKEIEKDEKIDKKDFNKILNSARKQEKQGIATIVKEKKKNRLFKERNDAKTSGARSWGKRIRAAFLTLGFGTTLFAGAKYLNPSNEEKTVTEDTKENLDDIIKQNNIKENSNISENTNKKEQNVNLNNTKNNEDKADINLEEDREVKLENEMKPGDYAKISESAMIFKDPTDWIRMKNGLNANEKVQIKNSSSDKMYKVTKIGYYSPTGEFVTIEVGQNLEEVLKAKGLDESFIEDENTVVMYHTVAEGIAQWVNADDVEKVEVRTDKFGNVVDKTEEQKIVDEAMENYYRQQSTTKQQTKTNNTEGVQKEEKSETTENQQNVYNTQTDEQIFSNSVKQQDNIEKVEAEIVSEEEYSKQLEKDIRNSNSKKDNIIIADATIIDDENER